MQLVRLAGQEGRHASGSIRFEVLKLADERAKCKGSRQSRSPLCLGRVGTVRLKRRGAQLILKTYRLCRIFGDEFQETISRDYAWRKSVTAQGAFTVSEKRSLTRMADARSWSILWPLKVPGDPLDLCKRSRTEPRPSEKLLVRGGGDQLLEVSDRPYPAVVQRPLRACRDRQSAHRQFISQS